VTIIDSSSVGDSSRFRSLDDLRQGLEAFPRERQDMGRVFFLMRRGENGRRESLKEALLEPAMGVPGDAWGRDAHRRQDMQIAVMQRNVVELIANGQPLALFGDCLMLELDLSTDNLPAGSQLWVGDALLEVTAMPHNGCQKFRSRFGQDALRFVSMRELRHRNLRGIYMRVLKAGIVKVGQPVNVIARPSTAA
jgi:MOSC domain-containing protein YiiM